MWIFTHEDKIMAIVKKEILAKEIAQKIKGKGYKVICAHEILDPEDVWSI